MIEQGTAGVVYQRPSYTFGPRGYTVTIHGRGNCADVEAEMAALIADGWQGTVTQVGDSPKSDLVATIATLDAGNPDTGLLTTWELDVQWKDVPVLKCRACWAYLESLGSASVYAPRMAGIAAASDQLRTGVTTLYDALPAGDKPWAFDDFVGETQPEPDAVLRRVNSYPPNTAFTADWSDVGLIFATSDITSLSDPPSAIVGTLEAGYWLKTSAGSRYGPDGRYEVATHWVFGRYPAHRFTAV